MLAQFIVQSEFTFGLQRQAGQRQEALGNTADLPQLIAAQRLCLAIIAGAGNYGERPPAGHHHHAHRRQAKMPAVRFQIGRDGFECAGFGRTGARRDQCGVGGLGQRNAGCTGQKQTTIDWHGISPPSQCVRAGPGASTPFGSLHLLPVIFLRIERQCWEIRTGQ